MLVHALPLFHQHGLGGLHATLIAGSTAHLRSRFDPADLIATVRAEGGTVLFGVPATYQALLGHADGAVAGSADGAPLLQGLRLAVCGSAPLSPVLAARLPALLGQLPLIRYGTTESGLDVSHPLGAARPETVGLPLPGVECRIWSAGREAPPGADGEIQLRGPQVFSGYWHDDGATAAAFTPDGWFRTGDIGAVDPATGHLVIRGRTKELIISGGLNVYPREVEIALERHPAVAEAAVAGLPHPRWGEQVTAWVVPRPGATVSEAELAAHARTLLAAYKCPKQVFTLTGLPRNPLGKLNRAALTRLGRPPDPLSRRTCARTGQITRLSARPRERWPPGEGNRGSGEQAAPVMRPPVTPWAGGPGRYRRCAGVQRYDRYIQAEHEPSAKLIFGIPSCQRATRKWPAWALEGVCGGSSAGRKGGSGHRGQQRYWPARR